MDMAMVLETDTNQWIGDDEVDEEGNVYEDNEAKRRRDEDDHEESFEHLAMLQWSGDDEVGEEAGLVESLRFLLLHDDYSKPHVPPHISALGGIYLFKPPKRRKGLHNLE